MRPPGKEFNYFNQGSFITPYPYNPSTEFFKIMQQRSLQGYFMHHCFTEITRICPRWGANLYETLLKGSSERRSFPFEFPRIGKERPLVPPTLPRPEGLPEMPHHGL